jgi:hypothetical protein
VTIVRFFKLVKLVLNCLNVNLPVNLFASWNTDRSPGTDDENVQFIS